jgi:hypothetical protein
VLAALVMIVEFGIECLLVGRQPISYHKPHDRMV